MLRAYFDDSGTHGPSKVVAVGGIMGTESELTSLEGMWADCLSSPLCGRKPPIKEFKSFDCFHSFGEFKGWKRHETDYFRHQLREIIIKSHVSAYGIAYFREDWDNIIIGDLRDILGNAEGNAIRNCFVRFYAWAIENTFDPNITFIFDNSDKLNIKRDALAVYDVFRSEIKNKIANGISFLDSEKFLPLQAADLFVWEYSKNAEIKLKSGIGSKTTQEMDHLANGMGWLEGHLARKDAILKVRDHALSEHPKEVLAEIADHFRAFGFDAFPESKTERKRGQKRGQNP